MSRARASWWVCGVSVLGLFISSALSQQPAPAEVPPVQFVDITRQAGITWRHVNGATEDKYLIETMGGGGAFLDYNRDGRLDIFLVNSGCHKFSVKCTPGKNALYRHNADGTFTDVSEASGIAKHEGKALGVVAFDFNRDGWMDLYVANDAVRNFLFRNNGDGTFTEMALLAEVAYGLQGKPQSGMGTDAADYDGDGWPDLFVTNIDYEPNNLYRNSGDETFTDVTISANLGSVALLFSAFGTRFIDYDNDGALDLVVLNGHVLDNIHLFREGVTFAERPFLLRNSGGRFQEVGARHGPAFEKAYVGRALATGDFDNDGDIDLLWVTNGGPPVLLRNDGGNRNAWIGFGLIGTASNRDAIGALVTVTAGGRRHVRELVGGSSYCAAHDLRLLFGLGTVEKVEKVEIRWPSGVTSQLENLAARRYYRVQEPEKEKPAAQDIKKAAKKPN